MLVSEYFDFLKKISITTYVYITFASRNWIRIRGEGALIKVMRVSGRWNRKGSGSGGKRINVSSAEADVSRYLKTASSLVQRAYATMLHVIPIATTLFYIDYSGVHVCVLQGLSASK